jgi:hypothetical protein
MIHRHSPSRSNGRSRLVLAVLGAAVAGSTALAAALAPPPLVLPLVSFLSVTVAALIAAAAWAAGARRGGEEITAWDVAGAFTLIGCAAAMLTQNEPALEYLIAPKSR